MLSKINRFFFGPMDRHGIVWVRVAMTTLMFANLMTMHVGWAEWFGWCRYWPSAWPVTSLWWATMAAVAFYAWGKYPFIATIILLYLFHAINKSGIPWGPQDGTLRFQLVWGLLYGNPKTNAEVRTWGVRAHQLQIVTVYLFVTLNKLYGSYAWQNGDFLFYALSNTSYSAWPWPRILTYAWFIKPLTWSSLVAESLVPLATFIKPLRNWMVVLLVYFHIGMAICMPGIGMFTLSMIPGVMLFLCAAPEKKKEVAVQYLTLAEAA